jgi:hypothetical protein
MRTTSQKRRGARSTALLSAAVLTASGIAATMGVANAVVTPSGGENGQGTPSFYKDAQGFALQLCLDGTPDVQCPPTDAEHLGAYFAADSNPVGPMTAGYAVEAVNDPVDGNLVINSARFRIEGAKANTTYTIKDPWRTTTCRTDGTGSADCRRETSGAFSTVRTGPVESFLRTVGPSASEFIGRHTAFSRVTGSPTGFNKIVMTGGGQKWITNRFSVAGQKRANTAMSSLSTRALELGNGRKADAVSKSVKYSSIGTANARPTVRKGGQNPGAFMVKDTCASQAPGTACAITVTFRPRQNVNTVKRAFLVIDDNGLAAPRKVSLKGVGLRR